MRERFERYLLELRLVLDAIDPEAVAAAVEILAGAETVFVAGFGRSGAILEAFAIRLARDGRRVHVVLEPGCPDFGRGDLLVLASGAGTSRLLPAVLSAAKEAGAASLLVTGNLLSPIYREADRTLYLPPTLAPGGPGRDREEPTRGSFEQALLLVLDALAELGSERRRELLRPDRS